MPTIIKRTTILVRDMDKALEFYRDILGLGVNYDEELTLAEELRPAGNAGDKVRLVMVAGEQPESGVIGLLQWLDPPMQGDAPNNQVGYGNPVFVLTVEDVQAIYEQAQAAGLKLLNPPAELVFPAIGGGEVRIKSIGVFDPDGHFLECNQPLSG